MCDFETNNNPEDCRVWLAGKYHIYTEEYEDFYNLDTFMAAVLEENCQIYFHNTKFDGSFILYWLFRSGYKFQDRRMPEPEHFSVLMGESGQYYSVTICSYRVQGTKSPHTEKKKVYTTIYNTANLIRLSVENMALKFGLEETKGEIDYNLNRPDGYLATPDERAYCKNDCIIAGKCLRKMLDMGLHKMTIGSNALADYKKMMGEKKYNYYFPPLTEYIETFCRLSYKGGFVYCMPNIKNKIIKNGTVIDKNAMYGWIMKTKQLPYGHPIWKDGPPSPSKKYPLFILQLVCSFKLKPGKLPSIQIRNHPLYVSTDYQTEVKDDVCLTLTSVDYYLLKENYIVYDEQFIGAYYFRSTTGLFDEYITKWSDIKEQAGREGRKGDRQVAKAMITNLSGKFGEKRQHKRKYPVYNDETDMMEYKKTKTETSNKGYVPVAAFVTSYARREVITSAIKISEYGWKKYNKECYNYSDTDSIHSLLTEEELKDIVKIDSEELGAWKVERKYDKGKYIRQKCYAHVVDNTTYVTCAGMKSKLAAKVTLSNFKPGTVYTGNLEAKLVSGGTILQEKNFELRG